MALHGHGVELWGYFWSFPFRSDAHEVFDANYASRKTATRILSAWKFVRLRMKQDSKSPCSSKLQRRVKITPGIGFRVVWLLLQSSNLLSIDPGTFSDACLLGSAECLHNANNWPIRITTTRSASSLVFDLRISSAFLPIQVNLCFSRHFHLHSACLWES